MQACQRNCCRCLLWRRAGAVVAAKARLALVCADMRCRPRRLCVWLGAQVESINLKGLDRVIFVTQHPESKLVLLRQYAVRYKKSGACRRRVACVLWTPLVRAALLIISGPHSILLSPLTGCSRLGGVAACMHACAAGTRVPRTELVEMGPSLDLELRRRRQAPSDLEREATKQPKADKKKVRARRPARARVRGRAGLAE